MPTLEYRGDYGASVTLASDRTASLTLNGTLPSGPVLVSSAYARIYVSTTQKPYTFQFHVAIDGGYYGDLDYKFSSNDTPVYVDVPITVTALDYYFPVKSISTITVSELGGHGSGVRIRGTVRVFVDYVNVGEPTLPYNVRINGTTAINLEAAHTATLTWSPGSLGAYDQSLTYRIRRYDVTAGTTEYLGTTQNTEYTITAPYTDSRSYYYYVDVITLFYTRSSSTFVSIYTFIQLTAPAFKIGLYNPRPMMLVTLGDGPIGELITLVADGWTPSRQGYPGDKIYLRKNTGYSANTSETVSVTETDQRMRSLATDASVVYNAPVYTNEEIIAGTTIVKAADITELQEILADIRTAYDMDAFTFTPCIAGETSLNLWITHITEIQNCITEIKDYINAWDTSSPNFAIVLPTMIATVGPSAAVLNQLRMLVTML